jgi:2-keto-3-deoxy-6-phosphogluconate aldolase
MRPLLSPRARVGWHRHRRGAVELARSDYAPAGTSIAALAAEFRNRLLIGAGTVMTAAQVTRIAAGGGKQIVTPHADAAIVRARNAMG